MKTDIFNAQQIKNLKRLGVQAVYLFGSRAQGKQTHLSDYDYAVLMGKKGYEKGDATYQRLYELFSQVSPRTLQNDVIDIVYLREAPLELRFHVIRYGKILLDSKPAERANFEAQTELLYCDYRPLLDEFDWNILQSL